MDDTCGSLMKLQVQIKPNSKYAEGVELVDGVYVVRVKPPATEGRANARAIELLAKHFGVPKTRVKIIRGATSKHKVFQIEI